MENDPETIRQEIEATRGRLADTAEAIAYKADVPARVKENVADRVDAVKSTVSDVASTVGATVGSTVSSVAHSAKASGATRENVGGFASTAKSTLSDVSQTAAAGVADLADKSKSAVAGAAGATRESVAGLASTAKETLSNVGETAKNTLSNAGQSAKNRLAGTTAAAGDLASRVPSSDDLSDYAGSARSFVTENPLGLALGSIAAGFLLGLTLPVSDVERDNVGPLGERVAAQAKAAASDIAEQGKAAVASAVSDAFKNNAQ